MERKELILEKLKNAHTPIKGLELANIYNVSRQVIVQDIAILRAQGYRILATSNGYIVERDQTNHGLIKTIVSTHKGIDRLEEELSIIIEYGGKLLNVIVEHPIYGEISGNLNIETQEDIRSFIQNVSQSNAKPLASLTDGEHIHTIEIKSEKLYQLMLWELVEKKFVKASFFDEVVDK